MLTEGEVFENEILSRTESTDNPAQKMPEGNSHGENLIGTSQIELVVKLLILRVFDLLANDNLDKGGRFEVRQTEVAPGQWEMTALLVDMKGKALLFKTIDVQQAESHSDFHRVPDDLTLAEAASILNGQTVIADNR